MAIIVENNQVKFDFSKTKAEKEALKLAKKQHKAELKKHYGSLLNNKVHNVLLGKKEELLENKRRVSKHLNRKILNLSKK